MGWEVGSQGGYVQSLGAELTADSLCVGDEGQGSFSQSGDVDVRRLDVGLYGTSSGSYRLCEGGTLTAGEIHIGQYGGNGTLRLAGGTLLSGPIYVYPSGSLFVSEIANQSSNVWTCSSRSVCWVGLSLPTARRRRRMERT